MCVGVGGGGGSGGSGRGEGDSVLIAKHQSSLHHNNAIALTAHHRPPDAD